MKTIQKKGISLVVLLITIVVVLILVGVIALNMSQNSPVSLASKYAFQNDLKSFETELNAYIINASTNDLRGFNSSKLHANSYSVTYDNVVDSSRTINDLIPSLVTKTEYYGKIEVKSGALIYKGLDPNYQEWAIEMGIEVIIDGEPMIAIIAQGETTVERGTDVNYSIEISSAVAITTVDLTEKVEVIDNNGVTLVTQPTLVIGEVSGTSSDTQRSVNVTIKTDTLEDGIYKLKLKAGAVTDADGMTNMRDAVSYKKFTIGIIIDTPITPPSYASNPVITASPTGWTNGSVTATITYPQEAAVKQYTLNGVTWEIYTSPIIINVNNITVFARALDSNGNENGLSSLTVTNIDKVPPTVAFGTNGGSNIQIASTTVTVSDTGGSNLNSNTLQYVWDTQSTVAPNTGWTTFTNGAVITNSATSGTYYLWIKGSDNAGNTVITKSNAFSVTAVATLGVNVVATDNTTINSEVATYFNPIIPKGFKAINTETIWPKDWNKGLVIEDTSGNQFVWVPVDGTNVTYEKWGTIGRAYNHSSISDDDLPPGVIEQNQIDNYGGFYIGRYEAMFDYNNGNIRAAIKKSKNASYNTWTKNNENTGNIWNNINYNDAKFYSEHMASSYGYDATKVVTTLVTGRQWDTTMKWIQNSGISVTDSRTWGNYWNATPPANVSGYGSLQVSGFSDHWKANNIYDLAGNTSEWINERYSSSRMMRGGSNGSSGSSAPASYRYESSINNAYSNYGFRTALFIKDNSSIVIENPSMFKNPSGFTNQDVTVTVTYPANSTSRQYSLDGSEWHDYIEPIIISTNNITVRSRCSDEHGTVIGQSMILVDNIDKIDPTVEFETNGGTDLEAASTKVTVSDTGGSDINTSTLQYVWDTQNTDEPTSGWVLFTNGQTLTKEYISGTFYLWIKAEDNAGNTVVSTSDSFQVTVDALGTGVIASENTTVNAEIPTYYNPIIPKGFKAVNDGAIWPTDWNKGLVIEDTSGNQFVWVPVDGTNVTYEKWGTIGRAYNHSSISDDDLPPGVIEQNQIDNYGGFYIGRYEAMFDYNNGNIRAGSKKSVNASSSSWVKNEENTGNVWNNVNYIDAKFYSELMAANYNYDTSKVVTTLVTGTQWDTAMKWIQNSGINVTDSRAWGNYWNSLSPADVSGYGYLQISGYSEHWKSNNIYDLAGNTSEWTNERYSSSRMMRGGSNGSSGTSSPASYRYESSISNAYSSYGFRVALFIKDDNIVINNPSILVNPTGWTNEDVTVSITYPSSTINEYSLDGIEWNIYTSPITISENNTTVYARSKDAAGNSVGQSSLTVSNIDKVAPTVEFGPNGGTDLQLASTIVNVMDEGASNLNPNKLQYIWDIQNTIQPTSGWTTFANGSVISKEYISGTFYLWIKAEDNAGNTVLTKSNAFVVTTSALGTDVIATENTTVNAEMPAYHNPIIPKGFKAINDGAVWPTDWNSGLVIEDESGNQFVWVPVDGTNVTYEKWTTSGTAFDHSSIYDDDLPVGIVEENQINKYGGFYIGRYEAMFDYNNGNIRAASKRGTNASNSSWVKNSENTGNVWNYINYIDAKFYSELMAVNYGYDTSKVATTLVTGTQWDTAMKWIQNSGINITDSRAWGNYWNSLAPSNVSGYGYLQLSGFSEHWKANNIYDLAGNTWEWTNERYSSSSVIRGGSNNSSGVTSPASTRNYTSMSDAYSSYGFRTALFIKDDNIVISNPTMLINPVGFTTESVTVQITYPTGASSKLYSLDGVIWEPYVNPIIINENETTIYAKCTDALGALIGQSTLTIGNIDKFAPAVEFATNGGSDLEAASTIVNVTDVGPSGVDESTLQYAWDTQDAVTPNSGWGTFINGETVEKTYTSGTYYLWIKASDNAGNSVISKSNAFEITSSSIGVDVIATENTTINAEVPTYHNPIIPKGFKAINDGTVWPTDWNKGLVIEDIDGNQFVWVPVDGTNVKYEKWTTSGILHDDTYLADDTLPLGVIEEDQITKYGGFYIGRYEVMFDYNDGNLRAASKKSTNRKTSNWASTRNEAHSGHIWNFINYNDAKSYAEAMAQSYNHDTSKIATTLLTGTQWDTAMKWIQNSGLDVLDSRSWGNHSNSISPADVSGRGSLQISGFSEYWKANNIYDLAGNTWEHTNETYYYWDYENVIRGGTYNSNGSSIPAAFRNSSYFYNTSANVSFRVALYIKEDNIVIPNPSILATPSTWTNEDVVVTIAYPTNTTIREYSFNGTDWIEYTSPILVSTTDTTIYARCKDISENLTGQSTLTISNIDKEAPTVAFGTNGGSNLESASTTVTVTDVGNSNLDLNTLQYVWTLQNTEEPSSGWTTFTNGQTITKEYTNGTFYLWIKASDNAGNTAITKTSAFEVTQALALGINVIATENTTLNAQMPTYYNPIIPKGFKAVNDGAIWPTDWNNGLVIEDESGNQFVWVPVDGTNVKYEKWTTLGVPYNDDYLTDDTLPTGFIEESQIANYGGFYIGRYEAMFDYNNGDLRAASKKSTNRKTSSWSSTRNEAHSGYLWNYINYNDAKSYAENMAQSYNHDTSKVVTTLVTGTQWDTTMKWIQNSGIDVSDSRSWGNHSNSISPADVSGRGSLQISGFSEHWKTKNIYDLAGNTWEHTNEMYFYWDYENIIRGGTYNSNGSTLPAAFRNSTYAYNTSANVSYRVALYIKEDNIVIANPSILVDPAGWTNGNVTVSIMYPSETTVKQYSMDGITWYNYTVPLTITDETTTVYAKCSNADGSLAGQSSLTIANIDKSPPVVEFGTNGGSDLAIGSTTVTVTDVGSSNVDSNTLQYVWDTQNTVTPTNGWESFINGETIIKKFVTGTYYLWIKASDNAGNTVIAKTNAFDLVSATNDFTFTNSYESWVVPATGTYLLEVWGAQGAGDSGKGAYAKGDIQLTAGQVIYIYVGGTNGFNGGGAGGIGANPGFNGGGATDIRTSQTLDSRVIVAGGGGGKGGNSNGGSSDRNAVLGGAGGGAHLNGTQHSNSGSGKFGYAGTALSGGVGGVGGTLSSTSSFDHIYYQAGGGGGGGGYYGGGGGGSGMLSGSTNNAAGQAGEDGSFATGGSGGNATHTVGVDGYYSYPGAGGGGGSSYVGTLANAIMLDANSTFLAPNEENETGHTGNGYARITRY